MENIEEKSEKIYSVSDYIKIVNQGLKNFKSKIIGEVSEVNFGPTGHVYFSLKDKEDNSVIQCVIWKYKYDIYGIELKEGLKIIAFGCPNIYAQRGNLSFIAEVIEYAGEGVLKKEYERLKNEFTKEGLFDESKKRLVPSYAQKIGVITARQGAVLADFLNNIGRFGFKIRMIDSRVEGQTAVSDILLSVRTFKKQDIDVLVIMRGGGSLESMLAFNNELLVREIANFPVPVVAAIGHHKDAPLAALAADCSVSTPSIAASLLNKSWEQTVLLLERQERAIISSYDNTLRNADLLTYKSIDTIQAINNLIFNKYREIEAAFKISFQALKNAVQNTKIDLKNSWEKSAFGLKSSLSVISRQLEHSDKIIYLNNPETRLKLGYSIARYNGKVVRSIKNVKIEKEIDIRVADGSIISNIKNIYPIK
ncbi:MAG: exodeoxyribonuclease VII large subunit [Patescibacteria group bacterium]|nr:exodeoxyribonuclease VII large subunit [Patescibacteria group bacterium]